jgi:hypothetical protein
LTSVYFRAFRFAKRCHGGMGSGSGKRSSALQVLPDLAVLIRAATGLDNI